MIYGNSSTNWNHCWKAPTRERPIILNPDYSWMGVWRMSVEDQIRALTRQYSYRRFPFRSGVEIHLSGEGGFILILGLNRRYMPRCVGNLNNQG